MIKGLAHLCLLSGDLQRTERFYRQGLGLTKAFDFRRGGEVVGFYLKAGDCSFLEFFRRDRSGPAADGPISHLCLEVESIDAMRRQLTAAGYELGPKTLGADRAWQAWTTDPDGVRIELHEYTSDCCQHSGRDCLLD